MRLSRMRHLAAEPSTVDTSARARASARPRTPGQEKSTPEKAVRRDSRTLMTLTSRMVRMMTQAGHAITPRIHRTERKAQAAMRASSRRMASTSMVAPMGCSERLAAAHPILGRRWHTLPGQSARPSGAAGRPRSCALTFAYVANRA